MADFCSFAVAFQHYCAITKYPNRLAKEVAQIAESNHLTKDECYAKLQENYVGMPENFIKWASTSQVRLDGLKDGKWFLNHKQHLEIKKNPSLAKDWDSYCYRNNNAIYFTWSTMALKASGLFKARSARTLRLISMPDLVSLSMNWL